jgi:hypothetical protein
MTQMLGKTRFGRGAVNIARAGWYLLRFFLDSVRTCDRIEAALDGAAHEKRAKAAKDYAAAEAIRTTLAAKVRQESARATKMEIKALSDKLDLYEKARSLGWNLFHDCNGGLILPEPSLKQHVDPRTPPDGRPVTEPRDSSDPKPSS